MVKATVDGMPIASAVLHGDDNDWDKIYPPVEDGPQGWQVAYGRLGLLTLAGDSAKAVAGMISHTRSKWADKPHELVPFQAELQDVHAGQAERFEQSVHAAARVVLTRLRIVSRRDGGVVCIEHRRELGRQAIAVFPRNPLRVAI